MAKMTKAQKQNLFAYLRDEVSKTTLFEYVPNVDDALSGGRTSCQYIWIKSKKSHIKKIGDFDLHYEIRVKNKKIYTMVHFENKYSNSFGNDVKEYCETKGLTLFEDTYMKSNGWLWYYCKDDVISLNDPMDIDKVVSQAIEKLRKLDKQFRGI